VTRAQVEQALRAAADVTGERDFFVIGSQSIHGQHPNPPVDILTMSNEVDLHAARYDPELAVELTGVLGYGSPFNELHGFYVDAVDPTTATLPDGWRYRVHVIESDNTIAAGSKLRIRGFCLDIHDLLVSKYAAAREKDLNLLELPLLQGTLTRRVSVPDWLRSRHALARTKRRSPKITLRAPLGRRAGFAPISQRVRSVWTACRSTVPSRSVSDHDGFSLRRAD